MRSISEMKGGEGKAKIEVDEVEEEREEDKTNKRCSEMRGGA